MFRQAKMYSGPARTGDVHIVFVVKLIFTFSGVSKAHTGSGRSMETFSVSSSAGVQGRILPPGTGIVRLTLPEKR